MKRIIFMGMAIMAIFVSSCKKEEEELLKDQTMQVSNRDLSNWGYDCSNVESILKAAGYEKYVFIKQGEIVKDGPAHYDPDNPEEFNCEGNPNAYCGVIIRPDKGNKDLILTTPNHPTVLKDIEDVVIDENNNGHIIK